MQNEWRDIAIGRTLTFDRGMIIPSKELKNGEICVPWMNEGEKILNFRSPFLNSNGLCVSINKHVEDYLGSDGKPLEGIIVVNDEDHKRIQARIDALKSQGIETDEIDPAETESERQGRDFDGDCIGVELASKYPNFTAEAEYRNQPENAYTPTVKLKKQSFYTEDGTQPEFEEIAIHMSDGISVGIINNHVTALEALESEIEILKTYGTFQQQSEYLDQVYNHYKKLFVLEDNQKNPQPIREEYREQMQKIVELASVQDRTPEVIEQAMEINRFMCRQMIESACFQNQIAVDLFKSAKKPDLDIIAENKRYLYRDVNYIKDKKSFSAYLNEGITTTGYSPVELLINQTNKYFQESQLESRPIVQFQNLFKGVEFTPQQKYQAILAKQKFDDKFNEATRLNKRRETEQGPYAIVQTSSGAQIEITNLTRYGHPGIWRATTLNIRLEEIPEKYRSPERPHTLLAVAQIDGEIENGEPKYRKLGTVSQQSVIDYKLKAGMTTEGATLAELKPELKESQTKLLFQEAYEEAENFYRSIPEDQKLSVAAATWSISASRQDELEQGDNSHLSTRKKVSNFVFAAFGDEIVSRLNELQFAEIKVLGINKEGDNFAGREWNPQQKYEIEIRASLHPAGHERHGSKLVFVKDNDGEYKEFAVLEQRTGQLPIGTKAEASIVPGEAYTATATIALPLKAPVDITIREISKFSQAGKTFNGEQVTLTIGNVPVPTDTAKIKLDGKILGELDADSIEELRKINYLKNGNPLNIKLKSIGSSKDEGAFIIAESPNGNFLRINKINSYDFKEQRFNEKEYRNVSLEIPATKNRDAVLLNGELLGVLHYKKDKEALQQLGILKLGQMGSVHCTLQSNFSHTFVKVDPSTVQYPKIWTKESQTFKNTTQKTVVTEQEVMVEKSAPFLQKIKERPTILFTSQQDKVLGLMGMAVDNHKIEVVQHWLHSKGIEFNPVAKEEVPLETKKGLEILYLATSTIQPDDLEALKAKFGEPLDANGENSVYSERLNSLPNRPHAIIVSKSQEKEVVISGTHMQMVFPLKMHGESNPLPVNTTIDAMRGYGRCHTTRTYEPYKAYGFKEGDIAIAVAGSKQVAFRVGKQYRITQEMITDLAYQQQWAAMEKHSAQELATFKNKPEVWGLHMEPLGDYTNGKIVPFPTPTLEQYRAAPTVSPSLPTSTPTWSTTTTISSPINIGSRSPDPLGAALTNPTVKAKELGNIKGDYPVSFRDNAAAPAGKYGPETYTQDKAAGVPFLSAEQVYQHYKQTVPLGEQRVQLMAEIIQAKLEQHPKLFEAITQRGGVAWLENCTHYVTSSRDNYWEGKGKDSPFIRALIEGYSRVLESSKTATLTDSLESQPINLGQKIATSPTTSNPLSNLKPLNDAVAHHMKKDVAMAEVATQFIGFSAAPPDTASSTRNYEQAWGERANTGVYSINDTIMVSGSGPWRGVTQQQILETFKNHYVPLLDKAIAAGSSFVVGNAAGTDQLVQQYLQEHGYKLEAQGDGYIRASSLELVTSVDSSKTQDVAPSPRFPAQPTSVPLTAVPAALTTTQNPFVASSQNIPQTGVMADTVGSYEQATIDSLRNWYSAADKLGKSEEYKNRIAEVATQFKSGQGLSEKALIAMNKDMEELRSINRLTQIAQRISDVLGQPGEGGSIQVKGKTYDISVNPYQKDLTIFHKNGDVLFDIKSGKVQTYQVSSESIKTFEDINAKIDTALSQVKFECIEM